MNKESEETLETHDLYLAAYLMLSGCVLVRKRSQGIRQFFIFSNPGGSIKELRDAYFSGTASVKPHDYAQKLIACKQLLFDG